VWCFFQKYGSKNLKSVEDNLKLSQQALCTICLTDMTRRAHCTVKLGKDNSPSSMMDHLRIHHLVEFDTVAVANSKGLTLAAFKTQQKEPRVRALLGNSSPGQSAQQSLTTPNATANAGNAAGAARHEASMLRHGALQTLFVHTTGEQAAASGKQRPVTDMFKPSSVWTEKQDNQWQEDLVRYVAEQYLPLATVDAPAFRSMIETLNPKASQPHRKGILRKMAEMRAVMEHEFVPLMRDEWVTITTDSWTSNAGQTYLGVSYHYVGADWEIRSMCVDCELLEGSTTGEDLVYGLVTHCCDVSHSYCPLHRRSVNT
jgi:hypothetical protein